ncbi:hypothetical protein [Kangiella sp. HZ709]|uniref:hypothetical protein n=1 Tax=Kangiella sp. HZ709 TaxID=2666328 RepID=UPI0012AFCDAD|nr:hypothetical protein [Kangiella sp. HZ709]MRX27680.1 hypothetical protein [Kangiella sp. HZ709]
MKDVVKLLELLSIESRLLDLPKLDLQKALEDKGFQSEAIQMVLENSYQDLDKLASSENVMALLFPAEDEESEEGNESDGDEAESKIAA